MVSMLSPPVSRKCGFLLCHSGSMLLLLLVMMMDHSCGCCRRGSCHCWEDRTRWHHMRCHHLHWIGRQRRHMLHHTHAVLAQHMWRHHVRRHHHWRRHRHGDCKSNNISTYFTHYTHTHNQLMPL
ncbi:LSm7 [Drosophila busckii]|uniref:LSm7 n=1 Tax=Drosophila busckii TaxID=30019 RepID=A0A0M4ECR5_DROBS|nr:LSm7 [Drosophila busckii]